MPPDPPDPVWPHTRLAFTHTGYPKSELEGANVSMLMPQPFSGRHASYLQRYTATSDPHILDSVREVVAQHRDRFV